MKSRVILLAAVAFAAEAHADVVSRFDVDNEGWFAADVSTTDLSILSSQAATWSAGHIGATEFGSQLFVLAAPAKFLGDKSAFYGGSVTYRLSDTVRDGIGYPNLLLRGNGFAMAYVTPPPAAAGTNYTIPLTEAGWIGLDQQPVTKTQFQNALANLDRFGINADWRTFSQDSVTLDDVVVANPVPEPATLAALGLGVVGVIRRRRRA